MFLIFKARQLFSIACVRWVRCLSVWMALAALSACASGAGGPGGPHKWGDAPLPASLKSMVDAADLPMSSVAVFAQPLGPSSAPRLAHNAQVAMQPGSAMKLVTSIVALERLGPLYRGSVEWLGTPDGDVLDGISVIRGLGHVELNHAAIVRWLKTLRDAGVRDIRGTVLIDRLLYNPARPDVGVAPFDSSTEFAYNVIPDALSLNMNLMGVRLKSGTHSVALSLDPALAGVALEGNFTLVNGPCAAWENGWKPPVVRHAHPDGTTTVVLSGTFPRDCTASTELNVLDRTLFAQAVLSSLWRQAGGQWSAQVRELAVGDVAALPTKVLASHSSRPLAEFLRDINKRSDNAMTRMTFSALASKATTGVATPAVSTTQQADGVVRAWLAQQGIAADGLVLDNGSGLSRSERISPYTLAAMLQVAAKSRWAPELLASMPVAGHDGTLRNRLKTGPGTARLKTGTLRNAYALAGYVQDANNEVLVFVAMVNDDKISGKAARALLDATVEWVEQSKGDKRVHGPSP